MRNSGVFLGRAKGFSFYEGLGAPTSSLAEECVDADGDVGVPALDQGQSSARWHRAALTGFWWM